MVVDDDVAQHVCFRYQVQQRTGQMLGGDRDGISVDSVGTLDLDVNRGWLWYENASNREMSVLVGFRPK